MRYLLDTNILLRLAQRSHPMHQEARASVRSLFREGHSLVLTPQIIYEFWVVSTRPISGNGLGLAPDRARRKIKKAQSFFQLILDPETIYGEWLRLVETHAISGVNAHDARLAAAMNIHGIKNLLTFNAADFRRFSPEITVITPADALRTKKMAD